MKIFAYPSKREVAFGVLFLFVALGAIAHDAARPNIVIIMADDMGYSDIGCYGGEIRTPNLDRLAAGGLRFTQFYNNAKCAPTRASLLTGLYSQQVGIDNGPATMHSSVTIAEVLKTAGYRTFMTGKWHANQLPVERGFDRYFGLTDGCSNYFNPGNPRMGEAVPAEKNFPRKWAIDAETIQPFTPKTSDFYSTDAFTDYALEYLESSREDSAPFFLYVAYTAPHYPLHAKPEDIAKYRGKYLQGWDAVRRDRLARMIDMGLIREGLELSPRDPRVPAWEQLGDESKWNLNALNGRRNLGITSEAATDADLWDLKMAVYAAMVDRMDQNIGRILDKIRDLGVEKNTLILFLSDNGGCAELQNITQDVPPGPANSYRTVDPPWANAQNTPFTKYKRWNYEGGIATPLIAYWPGRIAAGGITREVGHIIDLMATCVDLAGASYPSSFHGETILPMEGLSLSPVFGGASWEKPRTLFWQFGPSRAARQGPWKIVRDGHAPWELYDMKTDRTEQNDLAAKHPAVLDALSKLWDAWAHRVNAKLRGSIM